MTVMFTGLIEKLGHLEAITPRSDGAVMRIGHDAWTSPLEPGESVAVQGACLTAARPLSNAFECDILGETLSRTGWWFARTRNG